MYWGAAKFRYRTTALTANIDAMEQNVKNCLDDVVRHVGLVNSGREEPEVGERREIDGAFV
jgi:hypothetical protein